MSYIRTHLFTPSSLLNLQGEAAWKTKSSALARAGGEAKAAALEAARFDRDRFPAFVALADALILAQARVWVFRVLGLVPPSRPPPPPLPHSHCSNSLYNLLA